VTRRAGRGTSVIEALAALALSAIAIAGLAGAARVASQSLRLARDTTVALGLGCERLERLRVGPRANGSDTALGLDGTLFTRSWTQADGRGRPASLSARVQWGRHAVGLVTEAMP